jgi:hypothetical protein
MHSPSTERESHACHDGYRQCESWLPAPGFDLTQFVVKGNLHAGQRITRAPVTSSSSARGFCSGVAGEVVDDLVWVDLRGGVRSSWWIEAESTNQKEEEMRNVWRNTLVTVAIAVALAVGPGIGMANAAPTQLPVPLPEVPLPGLPQLPQLPQMPQLPQVPQL